MGSVSVDILAPGPYRSDPYDPGAPAWSLAAGLVGNGMDVRVVHPAGTDAETPPASLRVASFPALAPHLGYARGEAELAQAARRALRPDARLVVRDPLRPGTLGLGRGTGASSVIAHVRGLEIDAFDRASAAASGGVRGRWGQWRERNALRRLERAALDEARTILCEDADLRKRLSDAYGIDPARVLQLGRVVGLPEDLPTKEEARGIVGVPVDDPVVVAVAAASGSEDAGLARAREAFRRLRPIFAGAHLVLAGAEVPGGNAVTVRPSRALGDLVNSLAAGDIAVFLGDRPRTDPGVVACLRLGVTPVVAPGAFLPPELEIAVRRPVRDEPPELASVLAELLADPAGRRALSKDAGALAAPFLAPRASLRWLETVAPDSG